MTSERVGRLGIDGGATGDALTGRLAVRTGRGGNTGSTATGAGLGRRGIAGSCAICVDSGSDADGEDLLGREGIKGGSNSIFGKRGVTRSREDSETADMGTCRRDDFRRFPGGNADTKHESS